MLDGVRVNCRTEGKRMRMLTCRHFELNVATKFGYDCGFKDLLGLVEGTELILSCYAKGNCEKGLVRS